MSNMKNWLKLMESVEPQPVQEEEVVEAASCNNTAEGEECPVHGIKECSMYESEELTFEDWSVIYDSVNAKNVKASVRMKKDMNEAEVRDWFQRVFSPMGIHEMTRVATEEKIDEFTMGNLAPGGKVPNVKTSTASQTEVDVDGKKFSFDDPASASDFATKIKSGKVKMGEESDRPEQGMYKDLGDVYEPGPTEIWYWKEDAGRDMMMGKNFLIKHDRLPDPNNLAATHVKIGSVKETKPEKIFHMMQGEIWSPEGQARNMIRASGTGHTSMSVGDIVVVNGEPMMVDRFGFAKLDAEPAEESQVMEGRCHIRHSGAKALMEAHEVKLTVNDDHEVAMAQAELYRLAKDAIALHNMLDKMGNLEGWVSSKITLANDYVATVRDYIEDFVRNDGDVSDGPAMPEEPAEPAVAVGVPAIPTEANDEWDDEDEVEQPPSDPDADKVQHIVMQLKKAYDVGGNYPITFADGSKHKLDMETITAFLKKYIAAKPMEKEVMQKRASQSLLDFQATMEAVEESVVTNDTPVDVMAKIVAEKKANKVKFEDGSELMVDLNSASSMLGLYHGLKTEEKKKMFREAALKKVGFMKLLDRALAR